MIKGFDRETKPLTDYELNTLVPIVAYGMSFHRGKSEAVSSASICKSLQQKGYKIDGARLRKVINHIRLNDIVGCVIATSEGYYVSDNVAEIRDYIQSLESRANAIIAVSEALESQVSKINR